MVNLRNSGINELPPLFAAAHNKLAIVRRNDDGREIADMVAKAGQGGIVDNYLLLFAYGEFVD